MGKISISIEDDVSITKNIEGKVKSIIIKTSDNDYEIILNKTSKKISEKDISDLLDSL